MANALSYGFVSLAHLATERVTTVGMERVWDAIQMTADEWNRQINGLMASFVERTVLYSERFMLPGSGTLQPLDENGNPSVVRETGYFDVAYPLQGGGTAWGTNRVSRALMTVEEANRQTLMALQRDSDWVRRHLLASVFDNVAWSFADPEYGSITIQPLANTDTVTYLRVGGSNAVDEHYLAQAASIDDSNNPFDDIYDELMEHPQNSGPVVVYVPTNLVASIQALTAFIEVANPDVADGVQTAVLRTAFDRGFGDEVLGMVNKCWIVEWRALPDGYMIGHARGAGPVVKMREYYNGALQGLFTEQHSPDGNLQATRMIRYAGFGVANRIAACVYYVGGASYSIPSDYGAPLSA